MPLFGKAIGIQDKNLLQQFTYQNIDKFTEVILNLMNSEYTKGWNLFWKTISDDLKKEADSTLLKALIAKVGNKTYDELMELIEDKVLKAYGIPNITDVFGVVDIFARSWFKLAKVTLYVSKESKLFFDFANVDTEMNFDVEFSEEKITAIVPNKISILDRSSDYFYFKLKGNSLEKYADGGIVEILDKDVTNELLISGDIVKVNSEGTEVEIKIDRTGTRKEYYLYTIKDGGFW